MIKAGQTFGKWTVIQKGRSRSHPCGQKTKRWLCECECGRKKLVREDYLLSGTSKSCGCVSNRKKTFEFSGQRFGRLTVIRRGPIKVYNGGSKVATWWCRCDCGKQRIVSRRALKRGITTSCGCNRRADIRIGQKIECWTVVDYGPSRNGMSTWLCRCSCGKQKYVIGGSLMSGESTSCGCQNRVKPEDVKRRSTSYQEKWSAAIRKRDNHTCQVCRSGENLMAHHLFSFWRYPKLRFELVNGITMCNGCHRSFHNEYGPTPDLEDYTEFKKSVEIIVEKVS